MSYLGDLVKTQLIVDSFNVPPVERDEAWRDNLLLNLPAASFRAGDPQVLKGPDGFTYFQLLLPVPNESFECFVIDHMKDDFLLEKGVGVVIEPEEGGGAKWVLSYGDIVGLSLTGSLLTPKHNFSTAGQNGVMEDKQKVLVGQPSEWILPVHVRKYLQAHFAQYGVSDAGVLLMTMDTPDGPQYDLVLNTTSEKFSDQHAFEEAMQRTRWYLPRWYTIVVMNKGSLKGTLEGSFEPL